MTHQPGVYVPLRALFLVLQFITCNGFDINPGDRCILAKIGHKCNEKSDTETSYIY